MNTSIRLKEKFPKEIDLRGGLKATVRPMVATDEKALAEFFRRIPINERHLFKDDVTDGKVIEKWCRKIEYDRILPLLVICKDRIIADATLHRSGARAQSHVATIRISVDPEFRGLGLAKILIGELCDMAPSLGVAYVNAEVFPEQERAQKLFEDLDFVTVATLPQHSRDLSNKYHDIILMSHMSVAPEELSPEKEVDPADVDIGGPG